MKLQLNKDSLYARSLLLPVTKSTCLMLIGCGGTGSWLAPHVVRVAKLLQEVREQQVSVVFWDHDHVEAKNIFRQNFCEAEIGISKAVSLAHRYGHAWGIPITAIDTPFDKNIATRNEFLPSYREQRTTIAVTCVDNNAARREVAKMCKAWPVWWLDTGNVKTSGQVTVGRALMRDEPSPLRFPSKTTWLPMPTMQFPEILVDQEAHSSTQNVANLSCADLAIIDEQGLSINHSIASAAATLLMKMLVLGDLQYHCVHVSTESGASLVYNSSRIIKMYWKRRSSSRTNKNCDLESYAEEDVGVNDE